MLTSHRVSVQLGEKLGEKIVKLIDALNEDAKRNERTDGAKRHRIVQVVPVMQAFFAMSPERYETTEADVIVSTKFYANRENDAQREQD